MEKLESIIEDLSERIEELEAKQQLSDERILQLEALALQEI